MRTFFNVWSIIKIVVYGIAALIVVLGIFGVSSIAAGAGGYTSAVGGMYVLTLLLSLVSPVLVILMAAAGLRRSYDTCSKLAVSVIVLDVINLVFADPDARGRTFFILLLAVLYFLLLKKISVNSY